FVPSSIPGRRRARTTYGEMPRRSRPPGHALDTCLSPDIHSGDDLPCRPGRRLRVTSSMVTDSRNCEQCGAMFTPRREHARFCSARCRVAWNRLNAGATPAEGGALDWTITAMRETVDRLLRARGWDRPHAFAAISQAVWWITMVDATLVRYHPDAYDSVLAGHEAAGRRGPGGGVGGLRWRGTQDGYYV